MQSIQGVMAFALLFAVANIAAIALAALTTHTVGYVVILLLLIVTTAIRIADYLAAFGDDGNAELELSIISKSALLMTALLTGEYLICKSFLPYAYLEAVTILAFSGLMLCSTFAVMVTYAAASNNGNGSSLRKYLAPLLIGLPATMGVLNYLCETVIIEVQTKNVSFFILWAATLCLQSLFLNEVIGGVKWKRCHSDDATLSEASFAQIFAPVAMLYFGAIIGAGYYFEYFSKAVTIMHIAFGTVWFFAILFPALPHRRK